MESEMSFIEELSEAAGHVADTAGQAVVRIGRDGGRGAGTVIASGLVLTSAHNLRGSEVTVTFSDGRVATGSVKGVDSDGDLAVVAVDTGSVAPILWEPAAEGPKVGAAVFALALPAAGSGPRVTFGLVSSAGHGFRGPRGRLISDGVEHSAPLARGSSGGPLVDASGQLVAVNTHRPGDGLYLAVPATASLKARVDSLAAGESPARRQLGVALTPPRVARRLRAAVGLPARDGVLVRDVGDGTPAQAAGLTRGDLIAAAGGQPVTSIDALLTALDGVGPDGKLVLTVVRGNEDVTVEVSFPTA
jgi:serine protease Do